MVQKPRIGHPELRMALADSVAQLSHDHEVQVGVDATPIGHVALENHSLSIEKQDQHDLDGRSFQANLLGSLLTRGQPDGCGLLGSVVISEDPTLISTDN